MNVSSKQSDGRGKRRGFSIRIFLPDGTADGVRVVEKSNWTGIALVVPRSRMMAVKERDEFTHSGVYILVGPSSGDDLQMLYIGEGDPVKPRLESHHAKKDFWQTAIVFTSKDANLNKAHVRFLESRLIRLAHEANRSKLENANTPQEPSLSEPDRADMEAFLDEMLLIFPALGITLFEKPEAPTPDLTILYLKAKGIEAKGYESSQGFVVLAGSQAVVENVPSIPPSIADLRAQLLERGVLVQDSGRYRLTQDYTFSAPSGAACVLLGRSANGRIEWKDEHGVLLKELQSQHIKDEDE